MNYAFLIALLPISAFHLFDCYHDRERRKLSKPFLLPLIVLYYIFSLPDIKFAIPWLILAIIADWIGDVLLIPNGHLWFSLGGISFLTGHVSFVLTYMKRIDFSKVLWLLIVVAAIFYFGVSVIVIRALKPSTHKKMLIPMFFYLMCNSTMNLFALMQLMSIPCPGSIAVYVGALLFFISDCSLVLVRYYKNQDLVYRRHFTVMLSYILGIFLITQGILMLTIG